MRRFLNLLLLGLLPALLFTTSCKDDPADPTTPEFETLATYMVQNNLDLDNILDGWVTSGGGINVDETDYSVSDYYVIDLRGAADFDAGHIKDAHNATMANLLTEAANAGEKTILMVCYTGQTAGRATGLLKTMGYSAKSLKWGMCGWHEDLAGKWNSNATDFSSPNWASSGSPETPGEFSFPTINTGETEGAKILEARVQALLSRSDWGVSKTDVLANPENYFINNKWPQTSWDEYGHIAGAYRIDVAEGLKIGTDLETSGLKQLDSSKPVLTYCYTGQTSAITTAWLDVLGFNGKSLLFGANGITHSKLLSGSAGDAPKKSWQGASSGSSNNFGYYKTDGTYIPPK